MSCLEMTVTPVKSGTLTVNPVKEADMTIQHMPSAELTANPSECVKVSAKPTEDNVQLSFTPVEGASLTIGEVCSISVGSLVVLAASDGPLRTRDGGYLLLNPATNPPEG